MSIQNLPFGTPEKFHVLVEISKGSQDKYEYDEELHVIKLDRVLYGSQAFPTNYGFIPETRAEDGDHSDAMLFSTNPIPVGVIVEARAIGIMGMIDSGEQDNKILAVPVKDPRFEDFKDLSDIPAHVIKEIQNFYETYKVLQGKKVEVTGFEGPEKAIEELKRTSEVFKNKG